MLDNLRPPCVNAIKFTSPCAGTDDQHKKPSVENIRRMKGESRRMSSKHIHLLYAEYSKFTHPVFE